MILRRTDIATALRSKRSQRGLLDPYRYGGVVASGTWNPADKDADFTLSGGNLIASITQAGSTGGAIRATNPRDISASNYYFEVTHAGTNIGMITGFGSTSATLSTHPGTDANGYGYYPINNGVYHNNVIAVPDYFPVQTLITGVLIDFTAGTFTIKRGGKWYTHSYNSGISGTIYPMWGSGTSGSGSRVGTLNADGPFTLGLPVGATAWGGTWNSADKHTTVTLSGSDLVATVTAALGAVRGTQGRSSGRYYFEITESGADQTSGAGKSTANITTYPGASGGADRSWAYYRAVNQRYTDGTGTSMPGQQDSLTVGVWLNSGVLKFLGDGCTGPISHNGLGAGNRFPMTGLGSGAVGTYTGTLNVGATSFVEALPSGATAWG